VNQKQTTTQMIKPFVQKETEANQNEKQILYNQGQQVTHAYGHLLADVHLAGFAPAFPMSPLRQEIRPQTAQAHSLGRY
jgi:hypothetical protein